MKCEWKWLKNLGEMLKALFTPLSPEDREKALKPSHHPTVEEQNEHLLLPKG